MKQRIDKQIMVLMSLIFLVAFFLKLSHANDQVHSNLLTSQFCDDPALGMAIIKVESNFNNVMSEEGSTGLMQVKPSTAEWIKCTGTTQEQLMIPMLNIMCGCKYLNLLSKRYSKKELVIASYNAGSPKICRTGTLFPSGKKCSQGQLINQYYVEKVLENYKGMI